MEDMKKMVEVVSKVARLKLNDEEVERYSKDLESILDSFKILDEVKVEGVKEVFHPIENINVFREDKVEESFSNEEALSNTDNKKDGYFKGPVAIEK